MAGNFTLGLDARFQVGSVYAFQVHIAIGAVDEGTVVSSHVNGMLAAGDHEIGYVDAAMRFDMLQNALKFVPGRENSGNATEDAEIGVLESVLTRDGSFARIVRVPRTELTLGANFAGWQGVVERNRV